MLQCGGTKRDGSQCTVTVEAPQTLCWWHDPKNSERRVRAAAKGGRSRANKELTDAKKHIKTIIDDVLARKTNRNDAAVVFGGYRVLLQAISVELDVREQLNLIDRMERLEEQLERQRQKGSGWAV